eukprot:scaffold84673_cov40-Tisochrysis_lutea.AAC.1
MRKPFQELNVQDGNLASYVNSSQAKGRAATMHVMDKLWVAFAFRLFFCSPSLSDHNEPGITSFSFVLDVFLGVVVVV